MSNDPRTSDPSDILRRSRGLRDDFKQWLDDNRYSPLSRMEESAVDVFASWLLLNHKVTPRD